MIPPIDPVSRRALLKGAAATLLLPFLPSLSWAEDPHAPAPKPPKRWATILFANGIKNEYWTAAGVGAAMELGKTLSPLERHRGAFTVIDSLRILDEVYADGPHVPYFPNFLCGMRVPRAAPFTLAESCDQLMGRTVAKDCAVPTLTLGCEEPPFGLANGLPSILGSTISWSSPVTGVPPQFSPRDAFDEVFDVKGLMAEKSVLDCVADDLGSMQREVSPADRRKLDEFATSVRDLETRIDRATHPRSDGWRPAKAKTDLLRPAQSTAQVMQQGIDVRHRLMLKIMAAAFEMDRTRVATLLLEGDGSYVTIPCVNAPLHQIGHHGNIPGVVKQFQESNQYHVSLFADFLDRLAKVDEGASTLLDNSMLLFGCNVRDDHDGTNIPLILAGRGGGTLDPGRYLSFDKAEDRRLCNLHLALLQRMGVTGADGKPIQQFGNSIHPLQGI
jgi:hypothetical protein